MDILERKAWNAEVKRLLADKNATRPVQDERIAAACATAKALGHNLVGWVQHGEELRSRCTTCKEPAILRLKARGGPVSAGVALILRCRP